MFTQENPLIITETTAGRLCVYWDEYRTNRYLHIRYWYPDKLTGEWRPGIKGIAIPEHNVMKVLLGCKKVLEAQNEEEGTEGNSASGRANRNDAAASAAS